MSYIPDSVQETGFDGLARTNLSFRKGGPQTRRGRMASAMRKQCRYGKLT